MVINALFYQSNNCYGRCPYNQWNLCCSTVHAPIDMSATPLPRFVCNTCSKSEQFVSRVSTIHIKHYNKIHKFIFFSLKSNKIYDFFQIGLTEELEEWFAGTYGGRRNQERRNDTKNNFIHSFNIYVNIKHIKLNY